jgi:hypothetical protein
MVQDGSKIEIVGTVFLINPQKLLLMTLAQFKLLDKDKRYIVWLAKSVEIACYEKDGFMHVLYQLDDFYIELQFVKMCPDNITFIAFSDQERLEPFLNLIDISPVLPSYL